MEGWLQLEQVGLSQRLSAPSPGDDLRFLSALSTEDTLAILLAIAIARPWCTQARQLSPRPFIQAGGWDMAASLVDLHSSCASFGPSSPGFMLRSHHSHVVASMDETRKLAHGSLGGWFGRQNSCKIPAA